MKKIFTNLFLLLITFNLFSKDPYPKNPNIDILNYSFELHLNDSTDIIYGVANIKLHIEPSENNVRLDLVSKNDLGKGMIVKNILFNGPNKGWQEMNSKLQFFISLDKIDFTDVKSLKIWLGFIFFLIF